jgi:hypothetical protein
MLKLLELRAGAALRVYELELDGRSETGKFMDSLSEQARRRFRNVFRLLAESGRAGQSETGFRRLESIVYEIKEYSSNSRLFCFRWRDCIIVCTHGGKKPAGEAAYRREIDKVLRLYDLCRREGVLP